MVSRRKILSRSRDELHSDIYFMAEDDDEDVWYSKEKLYRVSSIIFTCFKYVESCRKVENVGIKPTFFFESLRKFFVL